MTNTKKYQVDHEELCSVHYITGPVEQADKWGVLVELDVELVKRYEKVMEEFDLLQREINAIVKEAKKNG